MELVPQAVQLLLQPFLRVEGLAQLGTRGLALRLLFLYPGVQGLSGGSMAPPLFLHRFQPGGRQPLGPAEVRGQPVYFLYMQGAHLDQLLVVPVLHLECFLPGLLDDFLVRQSLPVHFRALSLQISLQSFMLRRPFHLPSLELALQVRQATLVLLLDLLNELPVLLLH